MRLDKTKAKREYLGGDDLVVSVFPIDLLLPPVYSHRWCNQQLPTSTRAQASGKMEKRVVEALPSPL